MTRSETQTAVTAIDRVSRAIEHERRRLLAAFDHTIEHLTDNEGDAIPDDVWDDLSVEYHLGELRRETRRARRESGLPPLPEVSDD